MRNMWPKLMDLHEYQRHAFVGTPPTIITLKRRIDRGQLPGEVQGGRYYVLVGPDYAPMARSESNSRADLLIEQWLEETPRVERRPPG